MLHEFPIVLYTLTYHGTCMYLIQGKFFHV